MHKKINKFYEHPTPKADPVSEAQRRVIIYPGTHFSFICISQYSPVTHRSAIAKFTMNKLPSFLRRRSLSTAPITMTLPMLPTKVVANSKRRQRILRGDVTSLKLEGLAMAASVDWKIKVQLSVRCGLSEVFIGRAISTLILSTKKQWLVLTFAFKVFK